jgi:geranylgeranyl transferase type-2 subunit alpha
MHGRPREYKNKLKDPKAAEAYAKKVAAIKQGTALVLECRRLRRYDPAALKASEKLLKVVPEVSSVAGQHTQRQGVRVCMQQHGGP